MSKKCKSVKTPRQGVYIYLNNYLQPFNLVKIEAIPNQIREASKKKYNMLGTDAAMPPVAHAQCNTLLKGSWSILIG